MASSSSSPSSEENEPKNHPYQYNSRPGPKGSYEARQVNGGFYVRVDMPGVRPDGLKLKKYSETRTVTFSGKAPIIWENMDSSERVYGGYVVLDRDPLELDIDIELKNGCLRLFFPNAEGSLHNLTSKKSTHKPHNQDLAIHDVLDPFLYTGSSRYHKIQAMMNADPPDQETRDLINYIRELHVKENAPYQPARPDQVKGVHGGNFIHINPFLLSGVEGVYEHKVVQGDFSGRDDTLMYLRLDVPGLDRNQEWVKLADRGSEISFGGDGRKESRFDEAGRSYICMVIQRCYCCRYFKIKQLLQHGVLRILCHKVRVRSLPRK